MNIFNKYFRAARTTTVLLNKFRKSVIPLKATINDYYNIINLEILDLLENPVKIYIFFNIIEIIKELLIAANFYLFNNYLIINSFKPCAS